MLVHTCTRGEVVGSEDSCMMWNVSWGTNQGVRRPKFQSLPLANWAFDVLESIFLLIKRG